MKKINDHAVKPLALSGIFPKMDPADREEYGTPSVRVDRLDIITRGGSPGAGDSGGTSPEEIRT